jgi:uncharacterized protein (TIGR00159 family)
MTALEREIRALLPEFSLPDTPLGIVIALFDLLIVWYVFYRILLLIKGTRAFHVLVGIVIVALGFFGSKLLGLDTFRWLIENFTGSFVVILVVVFQDDIRRGLQRVGRRGLAATSSASLFAPHIDEVARAVTELSAKRIGALIVITREADLADRLEAGTTLDAKIASDLFLSILHTSSPLHDGAIIVTRARITRAGCFLPLTANPNVKRTLGTRHRAALGVAEETDAVAVVVSESTGRISVAADGVLAEMANSGDLRERLRELFDRRSIPRTRASAAEGVP